MTSDRSKFGLVKIEYSDAPLEHSAVRMNMPARQFTLVSGGIALTATFSREQFAAVALAALVSASDEGVDIESAIACLPSEQQAALRRLRDLISPSPLS